MTQPKKTHDDARIVVTLNFFIPKADRDTYPHPVHLDALNVVRCYIDRYEKGEISLSRLVEMAESVEVAAAK